MVTMVKAKLCGARIPLPISHNMQEMTFKNADRIGEFVAPRLTPLTCQTINLNAVFPVATPSARLSLPRPPPSVGETEQASRQEGIPALPCLRRDSFVTSNFNDI